MQGSGITAGLTNMAITTPLGPTPLPQTVTPRAASGPLPPVSILASYGGEAPPGATILDVPYMLRHIAKAHGARFDPTRRVWWLPQNVDAEGLQTLLAAGANTSRRPTRGTPTSPGCMAVLPSEPTPLPELAMPNRRRRPSSSANAIDLQTSPTVNPPVSPVAINLPTTSADVESNRTPAPRVNVSTHRLPCLKGGGCKG